MWVSATVYRRLLKTSAFFCQISLETQMSSVIIVWCKYLRMITNQYIPLYVFNSSALINRTLKSFRCTHFFLQIDWFWEQKQKKNSTFLWKMIDAFYLWTIVVFPCRNSTTAAARFGWCFLLLKGLRVKENRQAAIFLLKWKESRFWPNQEKKDFASVRFCAKIGNTTKSYKLNSSSIVFNPVIITLGAIQSAIVTRSQQIYYTGEREGKEVSGRDDRENLYIIVFWSSISTLWLVIITTIDYVCRGISLYKDYDIVIYGSVPFCLFGTLEIATCLTPGVLIPSPTTAIVAVFSLVSFVWLLDMKEPNSEKNVFRNWADITQ